jgi:hypothetical protein
MPSFANAAGASAAPTNAVTMIRTVHLPIS